MTSERLSNHWSISLLNELYVFSYSCRMRTTATKSRFVYSVETILSSFWKEHLACFIHVFDQYFCIICNIWTLLAILKHFLKYVSSAVNGAMLDKKWKLSWTYFIFMQNMKRIYNMMCDLLNVFGGRCCSFVK